MTVDFNQAEISSIIGLIEVELIENDLGSDDLEMALYKLIKAKERGDD